MIQSTRFSKTYIFVGLLAALPTLGMAASNDPIDTAPALSFFTQYNDSGAITRSLITVYNKKRESQGDYTIESGVPTDIQRALFSPTTQNPFKKAYATFYSPTNFKQLQRCQFIGADFNLDNNPKTEEWYISISATGCIKDQPYIDGGTSHNWITQRNEKGQFKVLMESDDSLMIDLVTSQSPYKPLNTIHNVMRFMPKSPLGCGDIYMKWRYNNTKKQYQYTFYNPRHAGCDQKFSYETVTDPGAKKAIAAVNKVVTPWVKNNLPAFR